jgi:hypothetical protein
MLSAKTLGEPHITRKRKSCRFWLWLLHFYNRYDNKTIYIGLSSTPSSPWSPLRRCLGFLWQGLMLLKCSFYIDINILLFTFSHPIQCLCLAAPVAWHTMIMEALPTASWPMRLSSLYYFPSVRKISGSSCFQATIHGPRLLSNCSFV